METSNNSNIAGLAEGFVVAGKYVITGRLGAGGFAIVYRARHVTGGYEVALKVMEIQKDLLDASYVERFYREAQIAAKINHENVVKIYDFGRIPETDQPYIAMELLRGHDLDEELLQHGALTPIRAYKLFLPVLEALGAGHKVGIIHKDLKPANLYIVNPDSEEQRLKVLDFGVARVNSSEYSKLTRAGQLMGTPRFLAPEYIKMQIVTPAIDVYQMALIICESMTGMVAVNCDTPYNAMMGHVLGTLKIHPFFKEGSVGEVFNKALSVDHEQRYNDCNEFARALESVASYFDSIVPLDSDGENEVNGDPMMRTSVSEVPDFEGMLTNVQDIVSDKPAPAVPTIPDSGNKKHKSSAVDEEAGTLLKSTAELMVTAKTTSETVHVQRPRHNLKFVALILCCVVVGLGLVAALLFVLGGGRKDSFEIIEHEEEVQYTAEQMAELPPEAREKALMKALALPPAPKESTEIRRLWAKAEEGDGESREVLGVYYMHLPKHRHNNEKAYSALQKIQNFTDDEALYYLAYLEYTYHAPLSESPSETRHKAVLRMKEAADRGFEPAMRFLLEHPEDESVDSASIESFLRSLYEKGERPEDYYRLGKLIEKRYRDNPEVNIAEVTKEFITYYRDSCDMGYRPACLEYINTLMCSDSKKAANMLKDNSKMGLAEYNGRLAEFFILASDPAIPNYPNYLCADRAREQFSIELKQIRNPEKEIVDYITASDGWINLDIMHAYLRNRADKHFNFMIKMEELIVEREGFSRKICDQLANINDIELSLGSESTAKYFNMSQLQIISSEVIQCYFKALVAGNDFSNYDVVENSTSYVLAGLYEGSAAWNVAEDTTKRLSALLFGAHSGDALSQILVAREYYNGTSWKKDAERACFWAKKASTSEFCEFCKLEVGQFLDVCEHCGEISEVLATCK